MNLKRPVVFLPLLAALFFVVSAHAGPGLAAPDALAAAQAGKLKIIDIRTPLEWWLSGTPPGAARIDYYRGLDRLMRDVLETTHGDRHAPIALICRTGVRTARAQAYLQQQGFTQVYNIGEGMAGSAVGPGWIKRGLPVESASSR